MSTNKLDHRSQLIRCLLDLAARAEELNEPHIQSILLVVSGAIMDSSDDEFALICADYAHIKILLDKGLLDENAQ